jgi:hypothetical protein
MMFPEVDVDLRLTDEVVLVAPGDRTAEPCHGDRENLKKSQVESLNTVFITV